VWWSEWVAVAEGEVLDDPFGVKQGRGGGGEGRDKNKNKSMLGMRSVGFLRASMCSFFFGL
jgi:hypothetical protein